MLQPRICRLPTTDASISSLASSLTALTLCSTQPSLTFNRHASHAAQGRANGPKDSAGRRLGAKKTASQWVIPGNIIFKQRGTKWHPGENVGIGKDHTIYSTVYGYVRYYQDPLRHRKRRFIGVALEREGPRSILPTPRNAASRRRLGMYASPIQQHAGTSDAAWLESHAIAGSKADTPAAQLPASDGAGGMVRTNVPPRAVPARPKHNLAWESNWSIGRTAERKGITVRDYDRKDRWLAWRKRNQKAKRTALMKAAKANRKGKGKGKGTGDKKKVQRKVAKVTRRS